MSFDVPVAPKFDQLLAVKCRQCKRVELLPVVAADVAAWKLGQLIQTAMPYLDADKREILISQTCGTCFEAMFSFEE
jgi:hypothetical protein|tara:strand:+ start:270 stop:500 length:231 start_codon:yes stop_codon:yes gene_type:complete